MKSTAQNGFAAPRTLSLLVGALMMAAGFACGPKVSREEMGEVIFEVPEVPGSEVPFPMPELEGAEPPRKRQTAMRPQGMLSLLRQLLPRRLIPRLQMSLMLGPSDGNPCLPVDCAAMAVLFAAGNVLFGGNLADWGIRDWLAIRTGDPVFSVVRAMRRISLELEGKVSPLGVGPSSSTLPAQRWPEF